MELATSPSISMTSISALNHPTLYASFTSRPFFSPLARTHPAVSLSKTSTKMASNGHIPTTSRATTAFSTNTSLPTTTNNHLSYTIIDSCIVMPPPPKSKTPRAIIKFLGGAFIGAIPQLTYGYLIEQLAKEGFLVILVPYNVTFDHAHAANQVYQRFNFCLENILTSGVPGSLTASQLVGLPVFSVGHSNGALLQVLTGSYFCDKIPKACYGGSTIL